MVFVLEPRYNNQVMENGFKPVPDARLPCVITGAFVFAIGIFWLTWKGNYPHHVHWIVGTFLILLVSFSVMDYLEYFWDPKTTLWTVICTLQPLPLQPIAF